MNVIKKLKQIAIYNKRMQNMADCMLYLYGASKDMGAVEMEMFIDGKKLTFKVEVETDD